ncbi:MAG: hypothetical protein LBC97_11320 [Bifidobacteriaceae bacterium]|nr:hypothetical protein [Bifidobacteriaceae bacterium]
MSRRIMVAAVAAALGVGWLAGCAKSGPEAAPEVLPSPTPRPTCPAVKELDQDQVAEFAQAVSAEVEGIALEFAAVGTKSGRLEIEADAPDSAALAELAKRAEAPLGCRSLEIWVNSAEDLAAAQALGLAEARVTFISLVKPNERSVVDALNALPGVVALDTVRNPFPWDLIAPQPVLSRVETAVSGDGQWETLKNAAPKLPVLAQLRLRIDPDDDWHWDALKGFRELAAVMICTDSCWFGDTGTLEDVSAETLEQILAVPPVLAKLETVNTIPVGELSAAALGFSQPQTRAERRAAREAEEQAEREAAEAEKHAYDLEPWLVQALRAQYEPGGAVTTIASPALVAIEEDGTAGPQLATVPTWRDDILEDWFCRRRDACVSVVVVSRRVGAESGSYRLENNRSGQEEFTGNLGETVVTIYNTADKTVSDPIVVATTLPPNMVGSKAEAIGALNEEAAWAWIAAHMTAPAGS